MTNVLLFELKATLKKWWIPFLIISTVVVFLILCAKIPDKMEVLNSYGYPFSSSKEEILSQYQDKINQINEAIAEGQISKDDAIGDLAKLNFFVSSGTTEYDYIPYREIFNLHQSVSNLPYGFSLLEGGKLINIALASSISLFIFSLPLDKGHIRAMIQIGAKRKDIFLGKSLYGLFWCLIYDLSLFLASLLLSKDNLSQAVLIGFKDSYISTSVLSLLLSSLLGMMLSSAFYLMLSSLIQMYLKRSFLSCFIPLFLFVFFFLFTNVSAPSWGNYGELIGESEYLTLFMPFSNIVLAPSYGFIYPISIFLIAFLFIDVFLFMASLKKFSYLDL
jgi:hypothetical protein